MRQAKAQATAGGTSLTFHCAKLVKPSCILATAVVVQGAQALQLLSSGATILQQHAQDHLAFINQSTHLRLFVNGEAIHLCPCLQC